MLQPRFRYSHMLVGKLLEIEAAQAAIDATGSSVPAPPGEDRYTAALKRVGRKSNECPTEDTINELRAAIDPKAEGYRGGGGLIYNVGRTDLVYIPPEPQDVADLMADLIDWLVELWDSAPAVVLSGVLEEEIALIQPFDRHNDELARLAGDSVLLRKGYAFVPAIQAHFQQQMEAYLGAVNAVHSGVFSEQADLSLWLEYYASEVADAATNARLASIGGAPPAAAQTSGAPAVGAPVILRERQVRALKYIQENGAIRSGEYQKLADIVPDTARRDFDDLLEKGLIEVRGVGRATHYVLTQFGVEQAERRRVS